MSGSENQPATKGDLAAVKGDLAAVKGDLTADLAAVKGDLTAVKSDLTAVKSDLTAVKGDIGVIRGDIMGLRDEMRELIRPITITLANHTAELADIRGHIKAKMVTREEFHSRMDGFAGRVDDFDYSSAKNRSRLDEHEKRISALEEKRA